MSTLPNGTPVTRAELKAELSEFKAELKTELSEMRNELFKQLREYIDERTHDAETRLLRAFADYQQAQTTRFRHMKADLGNLNTATDERLAALEQRMSNIEKRLIEKHI